jgi:hypothetical protein
MQVSTITWKFRLDGLHFREEDLVDFLAPTERVTRVGCNYGQVDLPGWKPKVRERTTNRGRKPKPKQRKERKLQGLGTEFASMIQFWVYGEHVRDVPQLVSDKPDYVRRTLPDRICEGISYRQESISKPYKPKLFRNGLVVMPGGICDDGRDVAEVMEHLIVYLNQTLYLGSDGPIRLLGHRSVMRNYKLRTLDGVRINMDSLQRYCNEHFYHLLNTNWEEIRQSILTPDFAFAYNPIEDGWKKTAEEWPDWGTLPRIRAEGVVAKLHDSKQHTKNLFVSRLRLEQMLTDLNLQSSYLIFLAFLRHSQWARCCNENTLKTVLRYMLHGYLERTHVQIEKHAENRMSYYTYNPAKNNAFQIRIKTPLPTNPNKVTMIKVFNSGCINIDGANSREEAEIIYWWVNHLLATNTCLTIQEGETTVADDDDEFSDSDNDEEELGEI